MVILSDSREALQAIYSPSPSRSKDIDECVDLLERLSDHNKTVVLQWILANCGIKGNETADFMAKKGTSFFTDKQPELGLPCDHGNFQKDPQMLLLTGYCYKKTTTRSGTAISMTFLSGAERNLSQCFFLAMVDSLNTSTELTWLPTVYVSYVTTRKKWTCFLLLLVLLCFLFPCGSDIGLPDINRRID